MRQVEGPRQVTRVWCALACLLCFWVASAAGAAIPVDPDAPRQSLSTGSLALWEDPSGEASLPEAPSSTGLGTASLRLALSEVGAGLRVESGAGRGTPATLGGVKAIF